MGIEATSGTWCGRWRVQTGTWDLVRDAATVGLLASLLFFTQLGGSKLWDRDEPRNARCAWEMLERNDWVVPTFNGELRAHKPILLYWVTMASYRCWGWNEFGARFGSAAAAVGTVLLTYLLGLRLFGRSTGIWASVVLATTLMFHVAARAATPDSLLIFLSTLGLTISIYSLPASLFSERGHAATHSAVRFRRPSLAAVIGLHAALGLAVLAKGPVGWLLPMTVIVAFRGLTWTDTSLSAWRDARLFLRFIRDFRPFTALIVVLLVAAPWYAYVGWKTDGEWLRIFFWEHHVHRATQAMEGHSGHPLVYYPMVLLVGFFPWSIFAMPSILWLGQQRPWRCQDLRLLFPLLWIGVYVALFSVAKTKLPSYVTPTYPALALLCGQFLTEWPSHVGGPARWWFRWSAASLMIVGIVLGIALPVIAQEFVPELQWVAWLAAIPIIGGLILLWLFWNERWRTGFCLIAASGALMTLAGFAWIGPRVSQENRIEELLQIAAMDRTSDTLVSFGVHEPSWIYYAQRTIPFYNAAQAADVTRLSRERDALVITSEHFLPQLQHATSHSCAILASVPNFLNDDRLLLVRMTP